VFVNADTIRLLLPELVLILAATAILVGGAFYRNRAVWHLAALAAFVAAGLVMALAPISKNLYGPATFDGLSEALRWLLVIAGVFFTSASWQSSSRELAPEQIGSIMLAVVGAMLAASANDLVLLFLGLELISIPTYMLLFVGRRDRESAEASAKYFFLSIASSAVLLYGLSFVYGLAGTTMLIGTTDTPGIRDAMLQLGDAPLASLGPFALLLVLAGLGFKLAAVPFHFYAPDVYQGTTATNAALLATLPKIAASAGIVRVVLECLPIEAGHAWQVLLVLSILSMTIGNVCALWQKNMRRLLAYSSIAHSGYMLIGLTVAQAGAAQGGLDPTFSGVSALVFYLAVYTFASIGSFAALSAMGTANREATSIDDLAGAGRTQPLPAAAMAVFMFSLAGIPPLAGFWGKFTLFSSAVNFATSSSGAASHWVIALAVIAALNAAVAAAYYLRVVGVMYFQSGASADRPALQPGGALAATLACAVLVIAIGVAPPYLLRATSAADASVHDVLIRGANSAATRSDAAPLVANLGDD
jgi:NADH-quinone oxidoreductase subunit N